MRPVERPMYQEIKYVYMSVFFFIEEPYFQLLFTLTMIFFIHICNC